MRNATEEQIVHAARQQSHFLETVRGIRPLKLFQRQDERRSVWLGLLVERLHGMQEVDGSIPSSSTKLPGIRGWFCGFLRRFRPLRLVA